MKTKDFIKMLQKADPTGEGYIRLPGGGAPWFAEEKEGYWDGPYQFLDYRKDKNGHDAVLTTSTKGYKIDIHVMDANSIIWDENGDMERIKKRIAFDYTYINGDEKISNSWKHIEEEAKYARGFHEKSLADWTTRTIDKYFSGGWEVRQPLDKKIGFFNSMIAHGFLGLTKETFCQGECMAVIESGKFYYEKENEYYVWKYDPEKGKNWSLK